MRGFLMTMALMVVMAVPAALNAQCAQCDLETLGCRWGPFKYGWTSCTSIGDGCLGSGVCGGGDSLLDLDGRVRFREFEVLPAMLLASSTSTVPTMASSDSPRLFQSRDCRGRLLATPLEAASGTSAGDILI